MDEYQVKLYNSIGMGLKSKQDHDNDGSHHHALEKC